MRFQYLHITVLAVVLGGTSISLAQTPSGTIKTSDPKDSVMIFESPHPLMEDVSSGSNTLNNTAGFTALINDYGFGLGLFYRRNLAGNLSGVVVFDFGGAKGPREFGLSNEIKINRIYVMPLMASLQYRLLSNTLSEGLRPYLTIGGGPTFVATNDAAQDFFTALGHLKFSTTFGGFFGFGANFGSDPKSTFGASLKYYIIPYRSPGVESTQGHFLTDFSGAALTVSYGFNF